MNTAYISLGSNIGDARTNLLRAIDRLRTLGEVFAISSRYETEPVDYADQPWFSNAVVGLRTDLGPEALLQSLLSIEREMGRERLIPKGPRLIDLDIVLFGDNVISSRTLRVPHPAMHERRFVLEPLAEIAPEVRHPVLQRTISQLLETLPQTEAVRKAEPLG